MTMDNSPSRRRLVIVLNILFGLIAVGFLVAVTKYLLLIVGLWAMGATRIFAVAIALAGYILIFVLSLVMCLRSKPAGRTSGKTVAWALSPLLGLLWIIISTSYLLGICNFSPFRCVAPAFHTTAPAPTDSTRSAIPPAASIPLPNGVGANGQPVKTFGGSQGEMARNRIIDIHACTDQRLRAWFNDDDLDHRPEMQRQKTIEFSNACAALIDGTGAQLTTERTESPDTHYPETRKEGNAAPSQLKIYRCPGPAGTTIFSDTPCPSVPAN